MFTYLAGQLIGSPNAISFYKGFLVGVEEGLINITQYGISVVIHSDFCSVGICNVLLLHSIEQEI